MQDLKLNIDALGKTVTVSFPDMPDAKKAFNDASIFVNNLIKHEKVRDLSIGLDPATATHEVVRDDSGNYRLKRFKFV